MPNHVPLGTNVYKHAAPSLIPRPSLSFSMLHTERLGNLEDEAICCSITEDRLFCVTLKSYYYMHDVSVQSYVCCRNYRRNVSKYIPQLNTIDTFRDSSGQVCMHTCIIMVIYYGMCGMRYILLIYKPFISSNLIVVTHVL